jgi:hypothetical protein
MIQDMESYYEATYLPPNTEYDGKFHSIAVKSLREGLEIRSRTGYLALPPETVPGTSAQTFELPLLKILGESPLPTDLSFRASVLRMGKIERTPAQTFIQRTSRSLQTSRTSRVLSSGDSAKMFHGAKQRKREIRPTSMLSLYSAVSSLLQANIRWKLLFWIAIAAKPARRLSLSMFQTHPVCRR